MRRLLLIALPFALFASNIARAAGTQVVKNPLKSQSLEELLLAVLRGVIQFGAIALLLALIWVGFLFASAQGNEEKLTNARNTLIWTIVGGAIILGAQVIASVIGATVSSLALSL